MIRRISDHDVYVSRIGERPKTLLIHCALAQHEALLPLVKALDRDAVLFDMPSHGRSGDWNGIGDYQGLVTEIAAALCDGRTHIIGHSFGATVALRLAVRQPELVGRLSLIEPVYFAAAAGTAVFNAHFQAFRPFVEAMEGGDAARAAAFFNGMWGVAEWDRLSERRKAYLTDRIHLISATADAIEADIGGFITPAHLAQLALPVTLIRGERSPEVMSAIHAALVDRLPNAVDHVIGDAGHMLPMTHTEPVAQVIRAVD